jgi:hypothetical protein
MNCTRMVIDNHPCTIRKTSQNRKLARTFTMLENIFQTCSFSTMRGKHAGRKRTQLNRDLEVYILDYCKAHLTHKELAKLRMTCKSYSRYITQHDMERIYWKSIVRPRVSPLKNSRTQDVLEGSVVYSKTGCPNKSSMLFALGSLCLYIGSLVLLGTCNKRYISIAKVAFAEQWAREHRLLVEDCMCRVDSSSIFQTCSSGTYKESPDGNWPLFDFSCTRYVKDSGPVFNKGTFQDLVDNTVYAEDRRTFRSNFGTVGYILLTVVASSVVCCISSVVLCAGEILHGKDFFFQLIAVSQKRKRFVLLPMLGCIVLFVCFFLLMWWVCTT